MVACPSAVRCVNSLGREETTRCSDYISTCDQDSWSLPIPLENGQKCYQGQTIQSSLCSTTASSVCSFTGIQCSNSMGEIVDHSCTN